MRIDCKKYKRIRSLKEGIERGELEKEKYYQSYI